MAAPQGGGGGGQSDNSAGILWGISAIFATIAIIWFSFKTYLIIFYLTIKLYEVDLINLVTENHYAGLHDALLFAIAHPSKLVISDILMLGQAVGHVIKYPFTLLLLVLAVVLYVGSATRIYRRTYSMNDLAKLEKKNWPQITPVVELNLLKIDIEKGSWAMAMTPMMFCKKYKLLTEMQMPRQEGVSRKEWRKIEVVLKRGDANRLFIMQLGPLWRGTNNLPPYTRALFAVFAARINADTKEALKLLSQFSASSSTKSIDYRGVDELLKKYENTKLVQKVLQEHAYVLTVMASMLEMARDDGVQASADFLWLKPVDRRLWYTLNCVGRRTAYVEVAGVFAHWVAEKEAGRRLLVPIVDEATKALEGMLKEVVYQPDEVK